jgi:hypothetical protein
MTSKSAARGNEGRKGRFRPPFLPNKASVITPLVVLTALLFAIAAASLLWTLGMVRIVGWAVR